MKNKDSLKQIPTEQAETHQPKGHDRLVLSWFTPEYIRHQKSAKWYLCAGLVTLAAIIWGLLSGNWSMVLAVIAFTLVYNYIDIKHPPKHIKIEISEFGIKVGHMFWDYAKIKAFWIIYEHGLSTLNLRVTNHFFSDIAIQLGEQDPVEVRHYLVTQVPEWEGKTERLGDMILRRFRL